MADPIGQLKLPRLLSELAIWHKAFVVHPTNGLVLAGPSARYGGIGSCQALVFAVLGVLSPPSASPATLVEVTPELVVDGLPFHGDCDRRRRPTARTKVHLQLICCMFNK